MTSREPRALVIFDCDGVLVDSERIANGVFAELITAIGLPTSFEECVATYLGRSMSSCTSLIEGRLGCPVPDDFVALYYERIYAAFDRGLAAVPGVVAALDALESSAAMTCVASSGPHERMRRTLGRTGLMTRFEGRIFSASEVPRGKPFPDLLVHAAARLDAKPDRCVVVEDSRAGVLAGRAAGMPVLGYADLTEPSELEAAGATVFRSMAELPALVAAALSGTG